MKGSRPKQATIAKIILSLCTIAVAAIMARCLAPKAVSAISGIDSRISLDLERRGIVFFADFDEALAVDRVKTKPLTCVNAPRVATFSGFGRRILPGRKESCVMAALPPQGIADEATFTMTIAPDAIDSRQEIINAANLESGLIVYIDGGKVLVTLHTGKNEAKIAADWPGAPGEPVRLAVAASRANTVLYINGREAGRAASPQPLALHPRRFALPSSMRYPFSGVVDNVAIWNRMLDSQEAVADFRSNGDIMRTGKPLLSAASSVSRSIASFGSAALRAFDRLHPFRGMPSSMRSDYPILALHTTAGDDRHFLRAHEKSLFNGYRTKKAANPRSIDLVFNGRRTTVEACLDDIYGRNPVCRRPAFVLSGDFAELLGECGMARLYPLEAHSLVHIDARDVLPLSGRFVRLYEDRVFKGIYALEPFDAQGSAWLARGDIRRALYFNGRPRPSDMPPWGETLDSARRAIDALALSDNLFPWSAIELKVQRQHLENKRLRMGFSEFKNPIAPIEAILGGNRAPMFITGDLELSKAGQEIEWTTSDPSLVSKTGKVVRPEGSRHQIVMLTAQNPNTGARQEYRLRVMAQNRTLPTLFVNMGSLPSKERKIDFSAVFMRSGVTLATVPLVGLAGEGCGLRHRGNTAYAKGVKRPMALKFSEPLAWPDPEHPVRRILLCSGRADPTRLKNKISFDAFSAAFKDGAFPAPRYVHCELFVNGEWMGVWEVCGSVRDLLPEKSLLYKIRGHNTNLWKVNDTGILDCVMKPDDLAGDPYSPIAEQFAFTSSAQDEAFAQEVESRFFLDNLIGYFAVMNFTGNADGIFMNQYLARRPGEERFLIIPWDCDETFHEGNMGRIRSNHLFSRVLTQHPDGKALVRKKWRTLREGALSDEAIFGRIASDAAALAPYMDEEWRLLKPEGFDGNFAEALSQLKNAVSRQLEFFDNAWLEKGKGGVMQ